MASTPPSGSPPNPTDGSGPSTHNTNHRTEQNGAKLQQQQLQQRRPGRALRQGQRHGGSMSLVNYLTTRNWTTYTNFHPVQVARNHPPFMRRLDFSKSLPVHDGCVNTICWNSTGEYILSGSDDCNLCITKPIDMFDTGQHYTVLHKVHTHHLGNIFCARFVPNSSDKRIVSCSSEGPIIVHDVNATDPSDGLLNFNCHSETIYEVVPLPDGERVFLSCGEDKTVRLFDMRVHRSCARAGTCPHPALIRNSHAMTTLQLHPLDSNLLLVGRGDGLGLVYDRRRLPDVTRFTRERAHAERIAGKPGPSYQFKHPLEGVVSQFSVPDMEESCRFTSLCYNRDGSEVLASYTGDYIYLFDHDRCSNFELVQTLPKRANKTPELAANDSDQTSDSNYRDRSAGRQDQTLGGQRDGARHQQARTAARGAGSARISRIRVRGDWSDTGVNSAPLSARSRTGDNGGAGGGGSGGGIRATGRRDQDATSRTSFIEQVAVTLGTQRVLNRQRFVPTEIVAGPIEWGAPSQDESNNSTQRQERSIAEEDEDDGDGDGDGDGEFNNDDNEGEEDSGDSGDDDDNSTLIDDEDRDTFQEYAEMTVRDLVDEANQEARRILGSADESTMMDTGGDERATQRQASASEDGSAAGRRRGVSSGTRAKFRKTLESLKTKYSDIPKFKPSVKYQGHRNSRTSIKEAIFWGDDYIMSGSDCGRIMVWEKASAKLVMAFQADERVVNCLAPNPATYVLASSGIDYDIKLWSTQSLRSGPLAVGEAELKRIVENNELMLEESRYTLSVPPHLFFRVLASLVQSSR